jgi:hypothetical protein
MRPTVERYLHDLRRELRRRGVDDARLLEEVREHLADAVTEARREGLAAEAAEGAAVERFGSAAAMAEQHARSRYRVLDLTLFFAAATIGLLIAYGDSRPGWDDTGVTAAALLVSGSILGFAAPRRPWLWGTAVGISTMAEAAAGAAGAGSGALLFLLILAFPLAGAYAGTLARRLLAAR